MKMLQGPQFGRPKFNGMGSVVTPPAEGETFHAAGQMNPNGEDLRAYNTGIVYLRPTHSIVYRDERGATRTAVARVVTTQPFFSMGRKVPGRIEGYRVQRPDGSMFVVHPSRIIAATALDLGLGPLGDSRPMSAFRFSGDAAAPAGQVGLRPGDTILTPAQTEEAMRAKTADYAANPYTGAPNPVKGVIQGMSDESVGRLLTGIGTAIGATMGTVTAAIQAGSAERIAEIQSATQRYIADR